MPIGASGFKGHDSDAAALSLLRRSLAAAVLCDSDGQVIASNDAGRPLADAIRQGSADLRGLLLSAAASGGLQVGRVVLGESEEEATAHEISILPLADGHLMLSARDATFEHNLTRALLKSRDLYKDLMHCSADFGWETDASGTFGYVSPAGALGWTPREMNGRHARILLGLSDEDMQTVFATRTPVRAVRIAARSRSGDPVTLLAAAVPVLAPDGRWLGARGVARDITRELERERALRLDQARKALHARIVLDIRTEAAPEDIVRVAAEASAGALRAEWAAALDAETGDPVALGALTLSPLARAAIAEQRADGSDDVAVRLGSDDSCLIASAGGHEALAAALVFRRDVVREAWRAHELELLNGVAGHLAVALKQAHMIRRLERLSRIDSLTGLLNRRAFYEEVAVRMGHQRRSGRPAAFLFIDLDHFKDLNDRFGHAAGDAALRALGQALSAGQRVGDLAGRIGGDEFVLWLEDTPLEGARRKADAVMALASEMKKAAMAPDAKLSMSIGLAQSDPARWPTPEAVTEAADAALYAAKRRGRSRIVIAGEEGENGA
ncbi:MAG: diguanylate cyclase [Rhodothalassiaceae bacterium]